MKKPQQSADDIVWGLFARVPKKFAQPTIEVAEYVLQKLICEDGIIRNSEDTISASTASELKPRVVHWLKRMLNHKRAEHAMCEEGTDEAESLQAFIHEMEEVLAACV